MEKTKCSKNAFPRFLCVFYGLGQTEVNRNAKRAEVALQPNWSEYQAHLPLSPYFRKT